MKRRWYYLGPILIAASILFHQPLLIVTGLLVLVVIGITDIWYTYCLHHLHYQRHFSEERALFGEQVTLSVSVENAKLLPLPWLEVEDMVPRALMIKGQQAVSVISDTTMLNNLFSIGWYERVTRRYTLQCNARGVHKFGPTLVRSGDVFGFLTHEQTITNWQYLLVYPLVVPLTSFNLPARHPFGERRAPRRLLEDPARVIGVRDYAYGDSLRRVHWKATARAMKLQSKIYEPTTTYTLVLFLNIMAQFDLSHGLQPELQELAICAAASVADWALNEGYAVGLYANTPMFRPEEKTEIQQEGEEEQGLHVTLAAQLKRRRIHLPPATSEEQRQRIMDALARIHPYFGNTIEEVIQRSRLPAGATIVLITSTVTDFLLDTLARLKQSGHAVTMLFVGDMPAPTRLAGLTIYHLGGSDTWKRLEKAYSASGSVSNTPGKDATIQQEPEWERISVGFRL